MTLQRTAACLGFAALAAAAGCSLIADYDGFQPPPECGKGIPGQTPDAPRGGTIKASGLAQRIRFLDDSKQASYGYDLDRACSGENGGGGSCTSTFQLAVDKPGGVDNALGDFLVGTGFINSEDLVSAAVTTGDHGIFIEIDGYNGGPDDGDVKVSLFNYAGYVSGGDARFDGSDQVIVTDDSFVNGQPQGDISQYADTKAYVTNGVLVAELESYELRLALPKSAVGAADAGSEKAIVKFPLTSAKLVGTIRVDGDKLTMPDAQIVGRITVDKIATQLQSLNVCDPSGLKNLLCKNLDLAATQAEDNTGKKCTAASAAIGLAVIPAKRNGHKDASKPVNNCGGPPPNPCL